MLGCMNRKRRTWLWGTAAIVSIWAVVTVGVLIARSQTPTAEKVLAFVENNQLDGLDPDEREDVIDRLADKVNRLPMEERQKMRVGDAARDFYNGMTPEERSRYLDLTLSRGMKQLMLAFNEMSRQERQKIVDEALEDIERFREDVASGKIDQQEELERENAEKFINEGLKAYLSDANADTKLDLQPLVEQMQSVMQGKRRR